VTIVVLLLAALTFAPSLANQFSMDDEPLASSEYMRVKGQPDPMIAELHPPGYYFSKAYWYPESVNDGLYRPVTIYSFALTYHLLGQHLAKDQEALPQHAINLALHVAVTFLVLTLLHTIGLERLPAHIGALCFGVHAIHSEVVAGVVGRAELLAAAFGLGGILLFIRSLGNVSSRRYISLTLATACLFLAYGSKENAVAFCPFLFCVLLAIYWQRRSDSETTPTLSAPMMAAAIVTLVPLAAYLALRQGIMNDVQQPLVSMIDYVVNPLSHYDLMTRLATAIKILGFGLCKCFAPFSLSASYGAEVFSPASFLDLGVLTSIAALGSWLFVGLRFARRVPALFIATAIFLGFSFITSNLPFPIGTVFAERLYYLPSLGPCILIALLVQRFPSKRLLLGAVALFVIGNIAIAWPRNAVWHDTKTLCLTEVENQPRSAGMLLKAANVLRGKNDDQALAYLNRALSIVPGYPHALREKTYLHKRRGEFAAAIAAARSAINSDYKETQGAKIFSYNAIVDIYEANGDRAKAIQVARETLKIDPLNGASWAAIARNAPDVLPKNELGAIFTRGLAAQRKMPRIIGFGASAPEVGIYLGIMGERIGVDPRTVFQLLEKSASELDPARSKGSLLADAFFHIGKAKARSGAISDARFLFEKLLRTPSLPAALRPKVTAAIRSLPKK
jgi:tetratricopeptide (TPR) repeat protein